MNKVYLAIGAYGLKLKRSKASTVFKELNNAATGNKTKMTTHPYKWCAAHTDDITSVGMVLKKLLIALLWEWCSDSQNLGRSSVQYGLMTALLWQYPSVSTDSPSLGNSVQHNLTPSKELAQYTHTKGV
jgi:hypothetical protein